MVLKSERIVQHIIGIKYNMSIVYMLVSLDIKLVIIISNCQM